MSFRNKNKFKQFIKLRENVQDQQKLLKFKKKKWKSFLRFYRKKLKNFKKFKPLDQSKYVVTRYGTKNTSYNKQFRDTLHSGKRLRLFYGGLLKKYFKKKIQTALKTNQINSKNCTSIETRFIELFETRLDTVLYRAKFAPSIRSARQLILHGNIYVNETQVKSKAYRLKHGDIIRLNLNCLDLYETYIIKSVKWPIPPKHIVINYKTLQIIFLGNLKTNNIANEFTFNLQLQKILANYF